MYTRMLIHTYIKICKCNTEKKLTLGWEEKKKVFPVASGIFCHRNINKIH